MPVSKNLDFGGAPSTLFCAYRLFTHENEVLRWNGKNHFKPYFAAIIDHNYDSARPARFSTVFYVAGSRRRELFLARDLSSEVSFGVQRPPLHEAARTQATWNKQLMTMTDAPNANDELQAWREVHDRLTKAILVAKEAVAVAKAQRRYYLEEHCANVTPEGKLVNTSAWKKSGKTTRKPAAKRKVAAADSTVEKRKRKVEVNETFFGYGMGPQPILPNDAAGMALAQMYAVNDQSNTAGDHPQMTPMQAAQSGGTTGFPPAVCLFVFPFAYCMYLK